MDFDSFSGFGDQGGKDTGLAKYLKDEWEVKTVVIFGVATDYCVIASARHAVEKGFRVYVIIDLMRGIDQEKEETKRKLFEDEGCIVLTKEEAHRILKLKKK